MVPAVGKGLATKLSEGSFLIAVFASIAFVATIFGARKKQTKHERTKAPQTAVFEYTCWSFERIIAPSPSYLVSLLGYL